MAITLYITIYIEGQVDPSWFGDHSIRATLIFCKNLDYTKALTRKRVNIHLGDEERIDTQSSIKSIWIKNITGTPTEFGEIEKINAFLKIIYHSVMTIAEIEGWDTKPLEKAYQLSIADNGNFIWHTQFKINKNRNLKGRVKISLEKDGKVPIVAEFLDNKSDTQFEISIIDTFLHFVDWERVFVKPTWLDNEKFGFSFLNSQLLIFANINLRKSETIISERNLDRQEIEGRLRQLTYREFNNDDEFRDWVNK